MDKEHQMEIQLWDFIDGTMPVAERSLVANLIAENAEWRTKYHELLEVHRLINATELEHPSLRFTKNVMEEIAKYHIASAAKSYINKKIVWGVGIFFLTVIFSFLIFGIMQIDWSAASDSKSAFGFDLGKMDYTKMFNNNFVNIFMMMNVVLCLMLFDRYLNKRKKQLIKKA